MSEAQSLLLLLIVLYLSDCLWWLPRNSRVLESARPGARWRWRSAASATSNQRGALIFLSPSPASVALQLDPWRFTFSPSGLLAWSSAAWDSLGRPAQPGWSLPWSDIESIDVAGESIRVDHRPVQRFPTAGAARKAAQFLQGLRSASEEKRESMIREFWDRQLETAGIQDRLDRAMADARPLRWCGSAQWIWMFVVAPVVTSLFGGHWVLGGLALGLLALVATNIVLFVRRHRRVFPKQRWTRIETAMVMGVSWPMAARGADALSRHALADQHPVAVAASLGGLKGRSEFLSRVLRDTAFPLGFDELDEEAREIALWHQKCIEPLFRVLAEPLASPEEMPSPCSEGDVAYCPRCTATYRRLEPECSECPGVALLSFESESATETGGLE